MSLFRFRLVLGALVLLAAAAPARADKCTAAKLKAIGKKEAAKLGCYAKAAATNNTTGLTVCLAKADTKFSSAFSKADTKGPCNGPAGLCECFVDECVTLVTRDLNGGGPSTCEAARLKAAAKKAKGVVGCSAKAAAKGIAVDSSCIQKAKAKYAAAFQKTSGCPGTQGAIESDVDGDCVARLGADSAGGAHIGTVCTLPPCTTANTPCGSCGTGLCVTLCDCGGLVCVNNGAAQTPAGGKCEGSAGVCPLGDLCVANVAAGGSCGTGELNVCAPPCP
jgi:hypothetical protein